VLALLLYCKNTTEQQKEQEEEAGLTLTHSHSLYLSLSFSLSISLYLLSLSLSKLTFISMSLYWMLVRSRLRSVNGGAMVTTQLTNWGE
jgi:hypothetical protein